MKAAVLSSEKGLASPRPRLEGPLGSAPPRLPVGIGGKQISGGIDIDASAWKAPLVRR